MSSWPKGLRRDPRGKATLHPICTTSHKRRYSSQGEARKALKRLRTGDRVRIYRCPGCKGHHFTSLIGKD